MYKLLKQTKIVVDDEIYLDQPNRKDKQYLILYLTDREIYNNTLRLPFPYTAKDADWWIKYVEDSKRKTGVLLNFAIRNQSNQLMGGISYHMKFGMSSHKDELGYWLARQYWNKGIMTKVLKKFVNYGFNTLNLIRIEATVFEHNISSARVLEKCGFKCEGLLKKYYLKDGVYINVRMYAIIK